MCFLNAVTHHALCLLKSTFLLNVSARVAAFTTPELPHKVTDAPFLSLFKSQLDETVLSQLQDPGDLLPRLISAPTPSLHTSAWLVPGP